MRINVPEAIKKKKESVPPKGWHNAKISRVETSEEEGKDSVVVWSFRAENRAWTYRQSVSDGEMASMLSELGFAGQEIETDDLNGTKARIKMRTYGDRSLAKVVAVKAIQ